MAGYTPPALTFWRPSPGSLFAGDVVSPVTTNLYAHAFGHAAGRANTTGVVSAFGYEAGRNITENSGFCLFGHTAGRAMTVGSSNVTIIGDIVGEVGMTNTLILGTGSVTRFRYDESNGYQFPSASATAGTITPTHTVTLSFNGTKYKIPCVAA